MAKRSKPFQSRRRRYESPKYEARVKKRRSTEAQLRRETVEKERLGERIKNPLKARKVTVDEIKPFLTRSGQILPKRINDLLGKIKSKTQKRIAKMIKRQRNESNLDCTLTVIPNGRFPWRMVPRVPYRLRPENQPENQPPLYPGYRRIYKILAKLFSPAEVTWIKEILDAPSLVFGFLYQEAKTKKNPAYYLESDYDFAIL